MGESPESSDIQRKRDKRSKAAEVFITPIADPERRSRCLADPELFLRTYFSTIFFNPFAIHHKRMIAAIHERAISGGDKAVAAPRGDGKTMVSVCMIVYILLATEIRYPVIIASTSKKARKLFGQIKNKFANRRKFPEFCSDFPEICDCITALDGAPSRANKQHVNNVKTEIVWTQDNIRLPYVEGSKYGGKTVGYFGLDSAIRGENDEESRPDFALIDDPETREVAFSPTNKHEDVEDMIDGDIAGLAGPGGTISRVVLTTIQNRRCYSFRVTDPKTKPTFAGERYGVLSTWPERMDLWAEYIGKRKEDQEKGDKDGLNALKYYLDNREEMERGAVVTNPHRFNQRANGDGVEVEVSAIQAFFNRIADWGLAAVKAELQNDPEEEETEQSLNLTAGKVQGRISGLLRNELPKADIIRITVGIDIGNHASHWAKIAWFGNATGVILDYGIMETANMKANADAAFITSKMVPALHNWRNEILAENPPEFCLVDSGSGLHQDAVYEFVRQVGGNPFAASKGWDSGRFNVGKDGPNRRPFMECYASLQPSDRIWLYNVNTEYWKNWVQERFTTPTFDEAQQFNDGALSLFSAPGNSKEHLSFSQHIVAEMREELYVEGKGIQRKWVSKNKNNHWLDAVALACAGAGVIGIRLVSRESLQIEIKKPVVKVANRFVTPSGQAYLATERK